ncbi:hypothetical protein F4776DRAFT_60690 [Hypoxylon sp. NC0597]|nr:hypothetical protein F4776DRAFT_60690 [Hypoxylon sp. NC0597]
MPVTELSLLSSSTPGEIPQAYRDLVVEAIGIQGKWCANYAPWLIKDRGAALFQQLKEKGILLIAAHWDSIDQHHACIESPANQKILGEVASYMDMAVVKPGHIEGLYMLPNSEDEGVIPALEAPVLSVTVWTVSRENKTQFEEAMGKVKGILDGLTTPYRHRGGWKIEKDQGKEDIEQYYVVGGIESIEKYLEDVKTGGYDEYIQALLSLGLDTDTKRYKRIA